MTFEDFKESAYSMWAASFETLTDNGLDAKTANEEARNLLQQVLMAYGAMKGNNE